MAPGTFARLERCQNANLDYCEAGMLWLWYGALIAIGSSIGLWWAGAHEPPDFPRCDFVCGHRLDAVDACSDRLQNGNGD